MDQDHSTQLSDSSVPRSKLWADYSEIRRTIRLARKELRESLRDRRTLATLVLMPLMVYPLLGSVIQKFAISRVDPSRPAAAVLIDNQIPIPLRVYLLNGGANEPDREGSEIEGHSAAGGSAATVEQITRGLSSSQSAELDEETPIRLELFENTIQQSPDMLVRDGTVQVAILRLPPELDRQSGELRPADYRVLSRRDDPLSRRAAVEVEGRLREFRDRGVRRLLRQTGMGVQAMPLITRVTLEAVGPKESPLSAFVPLMLVLMTMTGAVYPAIDLTAGERERGTLEMLLAAPVRRGQLLTAKFVAVFTVAVLTAIVNLTAMVLTLYAIGFDRIFADSGSLSLLVLQVLALLVVFASFFSAVLLSITSFARSFREAQAWLIPLMLVSLAPGIISLMPGVQLTPLLSLVPLINIVLLGKELFLGIAETESFVLTLLATGTYAVLALRLAARIFGSDTVLFAAGSGHISVAQPDGVTHEAVSLKLGLGTLFLLVPAFIVLAGVRGRLVSPDNLAGQLKLSAALTVLLFGVLPVVLVRTSRLRLAPAFALSSFSWSALSGAVLLGASLWCLTYEILLFGKGASGWSELLNDPRFLELAQRLTHDTPLSLRLLTLALIPAVCEELFFRGFLFSALQGSSSRWIRAWLLSTFYFAVFHVIADQSLAFARFPATFLLGLVLGWIRASTGSTFPGTVMHTISNGILLSLSDLQPLLSQTGLRLDVENETHLPVRLIIASLGMAAAGGLCIWFGRKTDLNHAAGISCAR